MRNKRKESSFNIRNIKETFESMSYEAVSSYRYLFMILIGADILGVYWYLGWKTVGIAFLIAFISFFVIFTVLEKRKMPEEEKTEEKKEEEKKEKPKEEENDSEFGFEIPSAEDYNERLEKAIGF